MRRALLALALALPAAAKPPAHPGFQGKEYGVLLLADGGGSGLRADLTALRRAMTGAAVESVDSAADGTAIQRAVDRLRGQHVGKIVAVPLEPLSESPTMEELRYLFGVRQDPATDTPDHDSPNQGGMRALKTESKPTISLPNNRGPKRLRSEAELVLAATIDKSPALAEILAERAKALARVPEKEAVVLVAKAPRSDKALAGWKTAAAAVAESVRAKGGFREAGVLYVRDGVRSGQQDKDRDENKAELRRLTTAGAVVAVPLGLEGSRLSKMLSRQLGSAMYRWNGKGLLGDQKLSDWIQSTAEAGSKLPDSRQYRDNAPGGFR